MKVYIGNNKQKWQFDPDFVYNVSYFAEISYSVYQDNEIKKILRNFVIYKLPDVLFVYLSRLRLKHLFFAFPIDRLLYKAYKNILEKLKRIVRSFRLKNKIRLFFGDI